MTTFEARNVFAVIQSPDYLSPFNLLSSIHYARYKIESFKTCRDLQWIVTLFFSLPVFVFQQTTYKRKPTPSFQI